MNPAKAVGFYKTSLWKKTRDAYFKSAFGMCERCENAGKIVHHKQHLNESNYEDIYFLIHFDNLELLCHSCHEQEHRPNKAYFDKYYFDDQGHMHQK